MNVDNTKTINILSLCTGCVLVLSTGIFRCVFRLGYEFKVFNMIIGLIIINMVNIVILGYFAFVSFPNSAMEKLPVAIGASIITIGAASIFLISNHNKWQWLYGTQLKAASVKTVIYSLPTYPKCFAYLGKTMPLCVKFIHSLCCFNVWFATHSIPFINKNILIERLAGVKQ